MMIPTYGHRQRRGGLLLAIMEAALNPDISINALIRGVQCELCRLGAPFEHGHHVVLGVEIPCDAEPEQAEQIAAENTPAVDDDELGEAPFETRRQVGL